jgi:hypothetical protein
MARDDARGNLTMAAMKTGSPRAVHTVAGALSGLRRVDCVRMVEADRPRFFVVGVGHRFPVEREVSAAVAASLLETLPCRYQWHTGNGAR